MRAFFSSRIKIEKMLIIIRLDLDIVDDERIVESILDHSETKCRLLGPRINIVVV